MKENNRYARFRDNRCQIDDALTFFVKELKAQDNLGPNFALGYLVSFVADHVAQQSGPQRQKFLDAIQQRRDFRKTDQQAQATDDLVV